jgi:hypothetical protein
LLVRPDGYVAWRVAEAIYDPDIATSLLRDAVAEVLGNPTLVAAT